MAGRYNSNPPTLFGYTRDKDFKIIRRRNKSYYSFEIEGMDAMVNDLKRMYNDMAAKEGIDIVRTAVKPIAARALAKVPQPGMSPYATGLLKRSIRTTRGRQDRRGVVASVLAGYSYRQTKGGKRGPKARAAYALQVEFGTDKTPELPFMRPAFDGHEQAIANNVRQLLKTKIIKWEFNNRLGRNGKVK